MYKIQSQHVKQNEAKSLNKRVISRFIRFKRDKRIPLMRELFKKWLKYQYAYITLEHLEDVTGYGRSQLIRLLEYLEDIGFLKRHNRVFSTTAYLPNIKVFTKDFLDELSVLIPEALTAMIRIHVISNSAIKSKNDTQYKNNIRESYSLPAVTWTPAVPRSFSFLLSWQERWEREGPRHEMGSSAHESSMFELQQWEIDHFDAMSASSLKELVY